METAKEYREAHVRFWTRLIETLKNAELCKKIFYNSDLSPDLALKQYVFKEFMAGVEEPHAYCFPCEWALTQCGKSEFDGCINCLLNIENPGPCLDGAYKRFRMALRRFKALNSSMAKLSAVFHAEKIRDLPINPRWGDTHGRS